MSSSKVFASMIDNSNGKMVTFNFIKQDGSTRVFICQFDVKNCVQHSNPNLRATDLFGSDDVPHQAQCRQRRSINTDLLK